MLEVWKYRETLVLEPTVDLADFGVRSRSRTGRASFSVDAASPEHQIVRS